MHSRSFGKCVTVVMLWTILLHHWMKWKRQIFWKAFGNICALNSLTALKSLRFQWEMLPAKCAEMETGLIKMWKVIMLKLCTSSVPKNCQMEKWWNLWIQKTAEEFVQPDEGGLYKKFSLEVVAFTRMQPSSPEYKKWHVMHSFAAEKCMQNKKTAV